MIAARNVAANLPQVLALPPEVFEVVVVQPAVSLPPLPLTKPARSAVSA
ncbi:MAG: hypothetical protein JWM02_2538 [Frankiales bacterium]|nr:hypothetical protein [Frankiales bacterium]